MLLDIQTLGVPSTITYCIANDNERQPNLVNTQRRRTDRQDGSGISPEESRQYGYSPTAVAIPHQTQALVSIRNGKHVC